METLNIIRYGSNGEGIALFDNKIIFVPHALEGESVECEIKKSNKSFCVANLKNIIKHSEHRVQPQCPYFYECGGCNLQHMDYQEQLKVKHQIVKNNIKKYSNLDLNINNLIASDNQFNYRNHITFAVNHQGELGFFKNGTHDVLKVKKCYLANDNINRCIDILNSYFFDNKLYGYNYTTKKGHIKQVDIKFVQNQLLITIIAVVNELPNLQNLYVRLNCLKLKYGVYLSINRQDNTVIYGKLKHLTGIKQIECLDNNIKSFISSYSFLQVNNYIKDLIYNQVLDYVDGDVVVDAYAGRGILSVMLSKKAKKVISIEILEQATIDAINMLNENNISNVECICGDCEQVLPMLNQKIDAIIIDPPRKGASVEVLNQILELSPKKIIYISCASNTLARDLKILTQNNNYSVTYVQPYDMFPNTKEIETLVFMEKK